jgi:PAS domain S-box-containing protein
MSVTNGPDPEFLKALETAPNMYLVLSPELYIITASDLYLQATETTRESIIGKHIFDAFPNNADLSDGDDGVEIIKVSLQEVLRTKKPNYIRIQRYDVQDRNHPGKFITRYWDPSHTPVLDKDGNIAYIIQLATNVIDKVTNEQGLLKSQLEQGAAIEQMNALNAKLLQTNIELRETQQNLALLNVQLEERVARRTRELAESENRYKESFNEQQALNEELAASNEEHAVINEELTTTNEELIETQHRLEHANQELAASSSRLRMAIESTQLGTWDYNPMSGELHWSKECRNIYGIPQTLEPSFEFFTGLIHSEDRNRVQESIAASMQPDQQSPYDLSYRIIRYNDRETRWIKVKGTVYFDQGQANRFIGTVLDITDVKMAEEKSAKLAAIIASSDDAIVSKTLESVITSWNGSAERIFGYTAEEMIGESIYKLIPKDRQQEEPEILSRLRSGERVEHFETRRLTKDGRLIDVSVSVSPVRDREGNIIGLSKIARDITERKQDETRKNDFIGMVSHELKTPLTSLNAYLQMLSQKAQNAADDFTSNALEQSVKQVRKMTAMINGFLNVSRLESGKIQIDKQPFDMADLVKESEAETRLMNPTHTFIFHPVEPTPLFADKDKISHVINNLISNAVKYSKPGSTIQVACVTDGDFARFSVSDEGIGIEKHHLTHLFKRYYRVESNSHISGFGIGLYLSAEIIERHDGRIWAESEPGKGSTFYFSLPVK